MIFFALRMLVLNSYFEQFLSSAGFSVMNCVLFLSGFFVSFEILSGFPKNKHSFLWLKLQTTRVCTVHIYKFTLYMCGCSVVCIERT